MTVASVDKTIDSQSALEVVRVMEWYLQHSDLRASAIESLVRAKNLLIPFTTAISRPAALNGNLFVTTFLCGVGRKGGKILRPRENMVRSSVEVIDALITSSGKGYVDEHKVKTCINCFKTMAGLAAQLTAR